MDYEKAQQIFNSPETIKVFYNQTPVWIERLNSKNQTAYVSMETPDEQKMNIPIQELTEG